MASSIGAKSEVAKCYMWSYSSSTKSSNLQVLLSIEAAESSLETTDCLGLNDSLLGRLAPSRLNMEVFPVILGIPLPNAP